MVRVYRSRNVAAKLVAHILFKKNYANFFKLLKKSHLPEKKKVHLTILKYFLKASHMDCM